VVLVVGGEGRRGGEADSRGRAAGGNLVTRRLLLGGGMGIAIHHDLS
jgi:hypothetical protein